MLLPSCGDILLSCKTLGRPIAVSGRTSSCNARYKDSLIRYMPY
ncbi:hypothetical protein HMPREF3185_00209 [Porphyromonas somerae]|uniref:Uncharacterized protein n=1 Tax=Porphyromonas somerae TaxID=322095 RepID=A0A134BEA5_9PORP|nr:hypothetical protein HMPREF3184_00209 [Porphyromonadaceae bacterium KA00676]KXB78268.1 hypothetical protein HMPREF3185_00209 [Porphyromonas somerae]